jgi:hypothetical protein
MQRQCNECTLCCRLLPVRELDKKANERCKHQSHHKGCKIYNKPGMPVSCSLWNCRWLVNDDTNTLSRPDRSHYVIDIFPDKILAIEDEGRIVEVQTVQIWVDPNYPDAWKDPALAEYLIRRGKEGIVGQIRFNSEKALIVIPPNMTENKKWVIKEGQMNVPGFVDELIEDLEERGIPVVRT